MGDYRQNFLELCLSPFQRSNARRQGLGAGIGRTGQHWKVSKEGNGKQPIPTHLPRVVVHAVVEQREVDFLVAGRLSSHDDQELNSRLTGEGGGTLISTRSEGLSPHYQLFSAHIIRLRYFAAMTRCSLEVTVIGNGSWRKKSPQGHIWANGKLGTQVRDLSYLVNESRKTKCVGSASAD